MNNQQPKVNISVSVEEIYNSLCPVCREALLKLFADKARGEGLQDALRRQLEQPAHPEPAKRPPSP